MTQSLTLEVVVCQLAFGEEDRQGFGGAELLSGLCHPGMHFVHGPLDGLPQVLEVVSARNHFNVIDKG